LYQTKRRLTLDQIKGTEVTYSNYIETDKLLSLQGSTLKGGLHHHDEHLFIVCHQAFELWFKQILHELTSVRDVLQRLLPTHENSYEQIRLNPHLVLECMHVCVHRVERADQILRYTLNTFDILETMHPADFLEFRDYIGPASGFQSVQMREMELLLGLKDIERVPCSFAHYTDPIQHDKRGLERLRKRKEQSSIRDLLYQWLDQSIADRVPSEFIPIFVKKKEENLKFQKSIWLSDEQMIEKAVQKELSQLQPFLNGDDSEEIQELKKADNMANIEERREHIRRRRRAILFIMSYRQQPEMYTFANLLDGLVGFEEALLIWRNKHARMVERMIGRRTGTGGSSGVDYLDSTTRYRLFTDLWQARTHFIRSTALPKMTLLPPSN
jgi:tryptophan 2,3-dioxygenase